MYNRQIPRNEINFQIKQNTSITIFIYLHLPNSSINIKLT